MGYVTVLSLSLSLDSVAFILNTPCLFSHDDKDDPAGKKELDEVADNLRHWKDNCAALGYESDGEILPQATLGAAGGSVDGDDAVVDRTAEVGFAPRGGGGGT